MKGKDFAYIAGTLAAGFLAYKVYSKTSALVSAGVDTASAVKDSVVKIVTEDLNPASDKNVVYSAVNAVGSAATGQAEFTLGGWIYDKTHADPVTGESPSLFSLDNYVNGVKTFWGIGDQGKDKLVDSVALQSDFRKSEIIAENAAAVTQAKQEEVRASAQSLFRIQELNQQAGYMPSAFDRMLATFH